MTYHTRYGIIYLVRVSRCRSLLKISKILLLHMVFLPRKEIVLNNTQNTYIELCQKTLLNAEDVMEILDCGRTKAYSIINKLNSERVKNNFPVFRGKVLAEHLYKTYGLDRELQIHNAMS